MSVSETFLKTLAIAGLVGAGTIAVNQSIDTIKKHKKVASEDVDDIVVEEEVAEEVQEESKTLTIDSKKMKDILVKAGYPEDGVDVLVNTIEADAKPEEAEVQAEVVEEPQVPKFTVVNEEVKQPSFKKEDK